MPRADPCGYRRGRALLAHHSAGADSACALSRRGESQQVQGVRYHVGVAGAAWRHLPPMPGADPCGDRPGEDQGEIQQVQEV